MRILSLITHFPNDEKWNASTTIITTIDPNWKKRSVFSQARFLVKVAPNWDRIIFFYGTRLPVLFWFLYLLRYLKNPRDHMIFTTWLCDLSTFSQPGRSLSQQLRDFARKYYFMLFVRIFQVIVVHSSREVTLYSKFFAVPIERFKFLRYYVREDAINQNLPKYQVKQATSPEYVLASGRSRDFSTFINAVRDLPIRAVLVGGAADRTILKDNIPPNLETYFEISFEAYRDWIINAAIFVVPLLADKPLRSLGQIATFEAVAQYVPVIAARTFHIQDYFTDNEVNFYEPQNAEQLKEHIQRLMASSDERKQLAQRAYDKMLSQFTPERYTEALLDLCKNSA